MLQCALGIPSNTAPNEVTNAPDGDLFAAAFTSRLDECSAHLR
jgi:hypothetical protein